MDVEEGFNQSCEYSEMEDRGKRMDTFVEAAIDGADLLVDAGFFYNGMSYCSVVVHE